MSASKIMCSTKGVLQNGRAMCGYVIVGDKSCSLKNGECALQESQTRNKAIPIQVKGGAA